MNKDNPVKEEEVIEWLKQLPPDNRFVYIEGRPDDPTGCVLCQYLKSKREKRFNIRGNEYTLNGKIYDIPLKLADAFLMAAMGTGGLFTTEELLKQFYSLNNYDHET